MSMPLQNILLNLCIALDAFRVQHYYILQIHSVSIELTYLTMAIVLASGYHQRVSKRERHFQGHIGSENEFAKYVL